MTPEGTVLLLAQVAFLGINFDLLYSKGPRSENPALIGLHYGTLLVSIYAALEPSLLTIGLTGPCWAALFLLVRRESEAASEAAAPPAKIVSFPSVPAVGLSAGVPAVKAKWVEPTVPEAESKRIARAVAEIKVVAKAGAGEDGWVLVGEKSTAHGPVKWFSKAIEGQPAMNKVVGTFPGPARMWADMNSDANFILKLESQMESMVTIEDLGPQTCVKHLKMKSVFWTAPRDSCYVSHEFAEEDGTLIQVRYSCEHPKAPANAGKFVRSEQSLGGYICRPSKDGRSCEVMQALDIDIKLPDMPAYAARKLDEFNAKLLANSVLDRQKVVVKNKAPWQAARYAAMAPIANAGGAEGAGPEDGAAAPPPAPPPSELLARLKVPVKTFDPAKFAGLWYEIAAVKGRFQKGLVASVADYTFEGGELKAELINWKSSSLTKQSIIKSATTNTLSPPEGVEIPEGHWPAHLACSLTINIGFMNITPGYNLTFRGLAGKEEGAYDVAYIVQDSLERAWIYAREKTVPEDLYQWVIEDLRKDGMDVDTISRTEHYDRDYPL